MENNQNRAVSGNIWKIYTQVPHRIFFGLGVAFIVFPMLWWTFHLFALQFLELDSIEVIPKEGHTILMIYGMATQFILGFILTVFPRWLQTTGVSLKKNLYLFFFFLSGFLLYILGFLYGRLFLVAGIFLVTLGFCFTVLILFSILRRSSVEDRLQPQICWLAFCGGTIGIGCYLFYLVFPELTVLYDAAYGIGTFFYVTLLILAVAYRMVPFFTSIVVPDFKGKKVPWVLKAWMFFLALKAFVFVSGIKEMYILADGGLLIATWVQFRNWEFFGKKKVMLLKYLYISLFWFPLSSIFYILAGITKLIDGYTNDSIEMAALHALTIGCIASIIYSMVTRVTLGHSGRALITGRFENTLFFILQVTVVTRLAVEFLELSGIDGRAYLFVSGITWLICFIPWATRNLSIYLSPRVDGNPG